MNSTLAYGRLVNESNNYSSVSTFIADLDAAAFLAAEAASRFLASEIFKVSGKSFSIIGIPISQV